MSKTDNDQKVRKFRRFMNAFFVVVMLLILGSCVSDIANVGGGYDRLQRMGHTFFAYLALFVALMVFTIFTQYKVEKKLSSTGTLLSVKKEAAPEEGAEPPQGRMVTFLVSFSKFLDRLITLFVGNKK